MPKVNEVLLQKVYEHFGLADYDVIQMVSREVWKKKYDDVMKQLVAPKGLRTAGIGFGDEKKFWKPEREVINYGLGSIFIDESKEQIITRQQKRKYPTGHLYSVRARRGNIWITADEVEMYRKTKNAWAKDTYEESLWHEVWEDTTARTFVNSYYLSHFAKLFRIPKHERDYGDPDGRSCLFSRPEPWEKVWRFHRVKDVPKFLKV
tara:strand:+ start:315 stop:932 length:618 start_codon:yes stop_codon:yes gene_type:complete